MITAQRVRVLAAGLLAGALVAVAAPALAANPVFPGGNGAKFSAEKSGVYCWTIKSKVPFHRTVDGKLEWFHGYFYCGSGDLKARKAFWMSAKKNPAVHQLIVQNHDFRFRVILRDWSVKHLGPLPSGLTIRVMRRFAEQLAIDSFTWWAKHVSHYWQWNKNRAYAGKAPEDLRKAVRKWYGKQLENDAPPGQDETTGGDELNSEGANISIEAYGSAPGGGNPGIRYDPRPVP